MSELEEKPYAITLDRIMLYMSVLVIMGLSDAAIPILPELSDSSTIANGAASSLIFSSYFIGALLTMIPFGVFADVYGHRMFILIGGLLTLVSGGVIIVSDNVWVIIAARFVEGAGCGAFFPSAFAMLTSFKKREQYVGEFNFILNLGLASGLVLAGILASTGIKNGLILFEGLMVPVFMISVMVLINNGPGISISGRNEIPSQFIKSGKAFMNPDYFQVWLMSFVLFGSSGVLIALYPDFSSNLMGKGELGTYLASVYLGAMITSMAVGRLLLDRDVIVRVGMGITGFGALAAIFHPMGLTLMGAGSGLGLVGLVTGVSYLDIEKGLAMGMFNTFTYAGLALLPLFSGLMIAKFQYTGVFLANSILLVLMVILPMKALKKKEM